MRYNLLVVWLSNAPGGNGTTYGNFSVKSRMRELTPQAIDEIRTLIKQENPLITGHPIITNVIYLGEIEYKSSKRVVWELCFTNKERTEGHTDFFDTYEEAVDAEIGDGSGTSTIRLRTYEPYAPSRDHDCGDDE